jgi:glycosyltransferase involved in cell wall biosynthesis
VGFFGAENVIFELAKGLQEDGEFLPVVGVLTSRKAPDALAEAARGHGIETVDFHCRSGFDISAIRTIRRFVAHEGISVIHSHGYKADFYAWAAARSLLLSTVATCHPWTEVNYSVRARLYTAFDKRILKSFTKLVAVSEMVRGELTRAGIPACMTSVIANGVDLERFGRTMPRDEARAELGLPRGRVIVGTIGRLVREKAHTLFLRAAQQILRVQPHLVFVIVGDGPLRSELEAEAKSLGIAASVVFTGVSDRIPDMLAAFDVFLLSSTSEGLPMVILEAMASRKPIITTGVGAIPSVVIHGTSGLVVRPDVTEISNALSYVLGNPSAAYRLAEGAYARVRQKYSAAAMTKDYVHLYREIGARL